jgi:hypothetical protein
MLAADSRKHKTTQETKSDNDMPELIVQDHNNDDENSEYSEQRTAAIVKKCKN